ncbi:hypothetical protein BD414DRAFT_477204 [Trametes punicea]|nr:hypothetical protein BD414DRAFT_477204 [Trametes punicea]
MPTESPGLLMHIVHRSRGKTYPFPLIRLPRGAILIRYIFVTVTTGRLGRSVCAGPVAE